MSKALNVKNRGLNFGNSKETALSRNSSLLRARNGNRDLSFSLFSRSFDSDEAKFKGEGQRINRKGDLYL